MENVENMENAVRTVRPESAPYQSVVHSPSSACSTWLNPYLASHFDDAKSKATTFDSVAFSDGEYQILDYVSAAFASSDYVAFALYGSEAYRAYGQGSAKLTPNGELVFNASTAATGTVGDWTAVSGSGSVPEPTSGLLMLLGFAGLALKRKRA